MCEEVEIAIELLQMEQDDNLEQEVTKKMQVLQSELEDFRIETLLKGKYDSNNAILTLHAGAGGTEAQDWTEMLFRMYQMYADRNRFSVEILDEDVGENSIIKQVNFMVSGKGAYAKFKFESGVHRVQRIPVTESSGRIHTSTATVAVLPEAKNVKIEINEKDLQIDYYRSGGAGGQHVNKTESAIRITHLPTGIIVQCQDERSQGKNKEKAMNWLKSKLYDYYQSQADSEYAASRKNQVGNGDRCEKIRTYNYPQSRITDHRINMTIYSLDTFMNGDIGSMVEALTIADQQAKLAQIQE